MSMNEAEINEFNRIRSIAHRQAEEMILLRTMIASRDQIFMKINKYLNERNIPIDQETAFTIKEVVCQMLDCRLDVQLGVKKEEEVEEVEEPNNVQRRLDNIEG